MSDLSFKLLQETAHPEGAVHEHGVFQGDKQIGSVKVLALKTGGIGGFKVAGGLKTGHFGAVSNYIRATHGELKMPATKPMAKSKRSDEVKAARENAALVYMPGADQGNAPSITPTFHQDTARSGQRAVCSTPDCGGRLTFSERRNKHGFTNTWQSCATCGTESIVPRRVATSADEATAAADDAQATRWQQERSMKKATVAQQNEDLAGVNLDHDRIRVLRAVQALVQGLETPHTPDGKVNVAKKKRLRKALESGDLLKAVPAMQRMDALHTTLRSMADDLVTRPEFNHHHDHAAYMMAHARHQLDMADRHMNLEKPRVIDRLHSALRMKPAYEKHLNAADTFIRAASNRMHDGDHTLFRMRVTEALPATQRVPMSMMDRVTVSRAYRGPDGRLPDRMVQGAASELRRHYDYAAKKAPATNTPAPAAATPAPVAKPKRTPKPRPADNA